MSSLQSSIIDRKAKLAALKNRSLKRKASESENTDPTESQPTDKPVTQQDELQAEESRPDTSVYLSGRNYDAQTRGPKLGFENNPSDSTSTLEARANALALAAKEVEDEKQQAEAESSTNGTVAGVDLFQLRPKKANWDLKRELAERMRVLDVRTENAIARLVRERIKGQQKGKGGGAGLEGPDLAEAVKVREMQEEEDERRERELLEEADA